MHKSFILLLFAVFSSSNIYSQIQDAILKQEELNRYDLIMNDETDSLPIQHVMLNEFSRIASVNSFNGLGNYIGVSTSDNSLSFQYSFIKNGNVFQISAAGGATDGVTNVINDSKFNSGVKVKGTYSFLLKNSGLEYNTFELEQIRNKNRDILLSYQDKNIDSLKSYKKLVKDSIDLEKKWKALKNKDTLYWRASGRPYLSDDKQAQLETKLIYLKSEKLNLEKHLASFDEITELRLEQLRDIRDSMDRKNPLAKENFRKDSIAIILEKLDLPNRIKSKQLEIDKVNTEINNNKYSKKEHDKVILEKKLAKRKFDLVCNKLVAEREKVRFNAIYRGNEENDKRLENYRKINKIRPIDVKLRWLSLAGGIEAQSISLFDQTLPFDNQLTKQLDLIGTFSTQYTYYRHSTKKTRHLLFKQNLKYFTAGLDLMYGNNVSSLRQVEVITTDSISATRYTIKSQKAYEGEYKSEIPTLKLRSDFYQYLGSNDNTAIHIRGTVDIGPHEPVYSSRIGVIFAATKKEDYKSIANIEVFFGLNDIFKTGREGSLLERNVLGLQATIPFNFKI